MVEPLSKNEQEEMKALQDERKATGGHISDSARTRLSELQNRAAETKESDKPEPKTGNFGGSSSGVGGKK